LHKRAPQARPMVARGEREARSPWNVREKKDRPGRPIETGQSVCRPSGARALFICDPGAACSLRSHLPLATIYRACSAQDPGPSTAPAALRTPAHLPRLRRSGPRPIYRACGASEPLESKSRQAVQNFSGFRTSKMTNGSCQFCNPV
jgi:hypothetical protein